MRRGRVRRAAPMLAPWLASWLASMLVLAACATAPRAPPSPAPAPDRSLYERVGGIAAITAAVDDGMLILAADTRINHHFGNADLPLLRRHLIELLCMRTGGPCTYTGASMSAAHEGMFIRGDEFDALVDDLRQSLEKLRVPAREQAEVLAILRQMKSAVIDH